MTWSGKDFWNENLFLICAVWEPKFVKKSATLCEIIAFFTGFIYLILTSTFLPKYLYLSIHICPSIPNNHLLNCLNDVF